MSTKITEQMSVDYSPVFGEFTLDIALNDDHYSMPYIEGSLVIGRREVREMIKVMERYLDE